MDTKEILNGFKAMAEKAIGTIKEEVDDFKHKWAPEAEIVSNRFEELKTQFLKGLSDMENELEVWLKEHPEGKAKIKQAIDETRLQLTLGKLKPWRNLKSSKNGLLLNGIS